MEVLRHPFAPACRWFPWRLGWLAVVMGFLAGDAFAGQRVLFSNSLAPMPARVAAGLKNPTAAELAQRVEIQVALRMRGYAKLVDRVGKGGAVSHAVLDKDRLPAAADYDAVLKRLKPE